MLTETPGADFGSQAPAFSLPGLDGNTVSLDQVMGPKGLVVAFICNHCPYVKAIIDSLVADAKTLDDAGVGFVAIMSNDFANYPDDRPDKMREFAAQHRFTFPYLVDQTQEVARAYGAVCTPDFFGYAADGSLVYRGRIDNIGMNGRGERIPELVQAMTAVAQQASLPDEQHPSIGCSIKWR